MLAGIGFALVALMIGYAHDLGAEVAKRLLRKAYGVMAIAGVIGVLMVYYIPKGVRPDVIAILHIITVTLVACLLARWPVRERWWGRLLLDLRRPRPVWVRALAALAIVVGVMAFWEKGGFAEPSPRKLAGAAQAVALAGWMFALYSRPEIRERGIVASGHLIPWNRIEGHWWDDTRGKALILRLNVGGWRRFFCSSNPVIVPAHLKDQVESLVQRYLREWPGV